MGMAIDKEELEDFNQMISMFVLFYKAIWSEVNKQFSELPQEEKHKVFAIIAPSIVGMLNMSADYDNTHEVIPKEKTIQRNKKR
jgi:uncharacterized protein YfbU (UPF0304 family)